MTRLLMRRLAWALPVLVVASVVVFGVVRSTTEPAPLQSSGLRSADVVRLREELRVDDSLAEQYLAWVGSLLHGDLGTSLVTGQPVWPELRSALWASIQLGLAGFTLALIGGVLLGVSGGRRPGGVVDHGGATVSLGLLSIPTFVAGFALQLVFVVWMSDLFGDTPFFTSRMNTPGESGLADRLAHLALPAICVAVQGIGIYARYVRAGVAEAMGSEHVRSARAWGVPERRIVWRHALRSSLGPLAAVAAIDLGVLFGGLVVTEYVFEWPGMGSYFLRAFADGDAVRVLPWTMLVVIGVLALTLVADVVHAGLDPRVRLD
jgi:peptide/nickel transport system permease protein